MRKNSPRKWLHAILDLLPVLILPIFGLAVRSDNNFQPIEVQAQVSKVVDFNQQSRELTNNYWWFVGANGELDNNNSYFTATERGGGVQPLTNYRPYFNNGHKYYMSVMIKNSVSNTSIYLNTGFENKYCVSGLDWQKIDIIISWDTTSGNWRYPAIIDSRESNFSRVDFYGINLIDLTQMFGSGNEPTLQQFNTWYPNDYYEFTLSKIELLKDYDTITYSDADVGSQMVYTLYNATDKYFNMNSVFNLSSVWSWIQLNIFNGNVPLIAYVIWQVIIYEFIVDILFIFYSFFMFLIDFCECLLEKPFNKINRGK